MTSIWDNALTLKYNPIQAMANASSIRKEKQKHLGTPLLCLESRYRNNNLGQMFFIISNSNLIRARVYLLYNTFKSVCEIEVASCLLMRRVRILRHRRDLLPPPWKRRGSPPRKKHYCWRVLVARAGHRRSFGSPQRPPVLRFLPQQWGR
jgi:hypothetical protein